LLLLHDDQRIDLPKGRIEKGESEIECALRELEEETGVDPSQVRIVERFRSVITTQKNGREKTLVIFCAEATGPLAITPHDHDDYLWVEWSPPHAFTDHPRIERALADWAEHEARGHQRGKQRKRAS
jgi:8-oxo-dGTP pyrophosphatase MutT (NUDIX family)